MTPSYPNELLVNQEDLSALLSTMAQWPAGSRPIRGPNSTPHNAQLRLQTPGQLHSKLKRPGGLQVEGKAAAVGRLKNLEIEIETDASETDPETPSEGKNKK